MLVLIDKELDVSKEMRAALYLFIEIETFAERWYLGNDGRSRELVFYDSLGIWVGIPFSNPFSHAEQMYGNTLVELFLIVTHHLVPSHRHVLSLFFAVNITEVMCF